MMKKSNTVTRFISVVLSAAIVFAAVGSYSPKAQAKTLSSLKNEYSSIQDKIEAGENKVSELESQQAEQEEIISALNEQVSSLNEQLDNVTTQKQLINEDIAAAEQKISKLNNELADLDTKINAKDEEIDKTVEVFCERMKANYMAGNTSVLELFTSSSDLSSFLNRLEMFKRVTESDQDLVNQLNEEIALIEKMQEDLRTKKTELQTQRTELLTKKNDLQVAEDDLTATQDQIYSKSKEVNEKLAALTEQKQTLQVSIEQYNKEMDAIDAEITDFLKQQASSGSSKPSTGSATTGSATSNVSSSGWAWPIPYSSSYISSTYGYRSDPATGSYKYHGGLDISMGGAYGKNIVATKAGTVLKVVHGSTGYGIYVMIDHGNGYVSLYGHCSAILVSQGQSVKQGQIIARIGSSGYSTGPHCHFEIRHNGEQVNPLNYVSKS